MHSLFSAKLFMSIRISDSRRMSFAPKLSYSSRKIKRIIGISGERMQNFMNFSIAKLEPQKSYRKNSILIGVFKQCECGGQNAQIGRNQALIFAWITCLWINVILRSRFVSFLNFMDAFLLAFFVMSLYHEANALKFVFLKNWVILKVQPSFAWPRELKRSIIHLNFWFLYPPGFLNSGPGKPFNLEESRETFSHLAFEIALSVFFPFAKLPFCSVHPRITLLSFEMPTAAAFPFCSQN